MTDLRYPKRLRLLRSSEFDRVFAARTSAASASIVLYGAANGLDHPRLGLVVSRQRGGAVVRSRWKRVLREAFRLTQHRLPALDLVCIPLANAVQDLHQLVESFPELAARIERRLQKKTRNAMAQADGEP